MKTIQVTFEDLQFLLRQPDMVATGEQTDIEVHQFFVGQKIKELDWKSIELHREHPEKPQKALSIVESWFAAYLTRPGGVE